MAEKRHALLSPSSADRWMQCPGSVCLCKDRPDTPTTAAAEGSLAHEVAEMVLKTGRPAEAFIGHQAFGHQCDAVMARHVQYYADTVHQYMTHPTDVLLVEVELDISRITGEAGAVGTADAVILSYVNQQITDIDLKYGQAVKVAAKDNRQLSIYGAATIEKYGVMSDWQTVQRVIVQPRAGGVSESSINVEDLRVFGATVLTAATKALHLLAHPDQAVLNLSPSESACKWCRAKADCPALRAEMQNEFHDIDSVPVDEGRAMVDMDTPSPALAVDRSDHREWSDDNAVAALFKSMRMKHDQMYDYRLISPKAAERLLAQAHPKQWVKLQQYVKRNEWPQTVSPSLGPRPAMVGNCSTKV